MAPDNTRAAATTSTAVLVASDNGRVLGIYVRAGGTAGTVVLKDGGSAGTTICTINTPSAVSMEYIAVPGAGISFGTDLHATLTNADGVTVFYATDSNSSS